MEEMCAKYNPEDWTYLRHHPNSWGLSSNQFFAELIVSKMINLTKIDFIYTEGFKHRSDLALGVRSMLEKVADRNISIINLANN
jgi:hypothetical protein